MKKKIINLFKNLVIQLILDELETALDKDEINGPDYTAVHWFLHQVKNKKGD